MSMEPVSPERNIGELSPSNLHLYLTDPTFVEYLNSFLLLPAFSNRIFYNEDTGYFEMVHDEGLLGCIEDGSTRSSSAATLFLPDDALGPSLDKKQSWDWIIQNRLPLFLRSDIYSEYKICKRLASYTADEAAENDSMGWKFVNPPHSGISTGLPLKIQEIEEYDDQDLRQSQILPDIASKGSDIDLSSQHCSQGLFSSQSDMQLNARMQERSGRRFKWRRSSSVEPETLTGSVQRRKLGLLSRLTDSSLSESLDTGMDIKANLQFVQLLSTKSGMTEFWKFLKGKAGENNWLFWLDAERIKYYEGKEQKRMLRELHEKYFHDSDCSLALPHNIRRSVNQSIHLTTKQLCEIQEVMIAGLTEYWCPRFLLHYTREQESLVDHSTPQLPNVFHPYSASSPIPQKSRNLKMHAFATPQTPSHTPTFKRLHMTTPINSNPVRPSQDVVSRNESAAPGQSRTSSVVNLTPSPKIIRKGLQTPPIRKELKADVSKMEKLPTINQSSKRMTASASRYNQLAKYSARHLQDNSQCASRMEGGDQDGIGKNRCRILSVSGTPIHPAKTPDRHFPRSPADIGKDMYKALFHCLAVENRKAGGYFMHFLEKLENKVYINSLLFWRDVQEYKALFVGKKFSPYSVEMKSKAIFGRYISEGSSCSIECSMDVIDIISFNLKPAYEDLFDLAEEHAVELLLVQWNVLCTQETNTFQQLEKVATPCSSVASSRSKTSLETMSVESIDYANTEIAIPRSPRQSMTYGPYRRRHAVVSFTPAPTSVATSLNDVINNPIELEYFKVFLNDKLAAQDLMCWMDIESFRGVPASDEVIRNIKAKKIKKNYLNKNYYFGPNSPASKEIQRMTMQAGGGQYGARLPPRPSTPVLREIQKHVRARLEKKWLAEFMMSPEFVERNRDTRLSGSWDRKMSMKANQLSFETSFLHSHEALQFRKFLTQKKTANFERFLKAKAQSGQSASTVYHPREDIEFWCEVQKYKAMCHAHTRGSTLKHKVKAIVDCYFCSASPPELQIDVPMYMIEYIRRKDQGGPYLFREAQAAVFTNLYNGWKEHQSFVADLTESEEKKAIDKLKKEIIQAQKQKREKEENERLEEESKKMRVPRFETAEEREHRTRHERDLAEFGPVAVEFRLSTPDPWNYTYFTDLPDKYYAHEGEPKLRRSALSQSSSISHQLTGAAPSTAGESGPPIMMKLEGSKPIPHHIKERLKKPEVPLSAMLKETDVSGATPCLTDEAESMQKGNCNDSSASVEEKGQRRGHKGKGRKPKRPLSSTFPRITLRTISMKMSTIDKGEAYAYGSGIIEEHSSFLEITSKS